MNIKVVADASLEQPGRHILSISFITILVHLPAPSEQTLPVNLDTGLAGDLMPSEIRVVRAVNKIMRQGLLHVVA